MKPNILLEEHQQGREIVTLMSNLPPESLLNLKFRSDGTCPTKQRLNDSVCAREMPWLNEWFLKKVVPRSCNTAPGYTKIYNQGLDSHLQNHKSPQ